MAVGSCCYGSSHIFCDKKRKKNEFAPAGGGDSRSKLRRNGSLLRLASSPTEQATTSQIMAHAGRFRTLNSLLSTTPPMAVRLNLHSDVLEESALRSTTDGTLSSAIAGLESRIAPHREKLAAGRMLPAAAFAGGDGDLSKLKALKEVACMIQKLGSMTFHDACIMLVHVRHRFYDV